MWKKYIIITIVVLFTILLSSYYYLTHFPKNEFIEKLLIAVFSLIGGFYSAYILAKFKEDSEAIKSHFDDLKRVVILPIIKNVQSDIHSLPSPKSILEYNKPIENDINYFLCNDFLKNHNPEVKELWDNTYESLIKLDLNKKKIRLTIEEDIDEIINKIRNDPRPLIDWEIREENLEEFKESLTLDLINRRYKEELVKITKLNRLIYPEQPQINSLDPLDEILGPIQGEITIAIPRFNNSLSLQQLRKLIIDEIKTLQIKIDEIQKAQEQLDKNSAMFLTELNHLLFKSTLDHKRCDIIK